MKKVSIVTFLLFFVLTNLVHAQKNLQPGYVILNNNDTLKGFIDYKEWHRNPSSISFSTSKDENAKKYTTSDIVYFEVIGKESYRQYVVRVSQDTQLLSDLSDKDTTTLIESVFLKVIHHGKNIDLFSYKDETKFRWYVRPANELAPFELLSSVYRVDNRIINEREYRSQLSKVASVYLPGNTEISNTVMKNDYTKKMMLDLCYRINGIDEDELNKQKESERKNRVSPFRFFVGAGVTQGQVSCTGANRYSGITSSTTYTPMIGVGVDIYPIPAVGKLFVRNHLFITALKAEMSSPTEHYFEATVNYYLSLKQVNLSWHSQLSYNLYNRSDFKWSIGAGVGFNFSSYPTNQQTYIREGLNAANSVNDNYLEFTNAFWLNSSLRTGIVYRNIEISFVHFSAASLSDYVSFSFSGSSSQLQLNYLLGKRRE